MIRRRVNVATVVVLILSLVVAGVMRQLAISFQEKHSPFSRRTTSAGGSSLAGMDTYALALLLGGLRGPLVMILWAQSESQKADRDLEGINTQIEWIRRLQPEFDTVHVFQMWNKAYNLSVQMVGLANKYSTILDALDYGKSVDAERPDNMNILKEIARIYGDKLATSNPEKYYYRDRIRRESKWHEQGATTAGQRGTPGFQRLAHDPVLDRDGNILPELLKPTRAVDPNAKGDQYDGSELQFLKRYEPFPYGVSPVALGYNYHKRAQVLWTNDKQKPLQVSESVVDSQPALGLKSWTEEEFERARRMELGAMGLKVPPERVDMEVPSASHAPGAPLKDASHLAEMLYSFDMTGRLAGDAIAEYERHLANPEFVTKRMMYASHIDTLSTMRAVSSADADYVRAIQSKDPQEKAKLLASAARHYHESIRMAGLTAIRYYTGDGLAAKILPAGVTRANIGTGPLGAKTQVTDEDVLHLLDALHAEARKPTSGDMNEEDRQEYMRYVERATERLKQIGQAGAGATPAKSS
jgi:hypothetical protein